MSRKGWCILPPPVPCLHPERSTQAQQDQNFQEVKGINWAEEME